MIAKILSSYSILGITLSDFYRELSQNSLEEGNALGIALYDWQRCLIY